MCLMKLMKCSRFINYNNSYMSHVTIIHIEYSTDYKLLSAFIYRLWYLRQRRSTHQEVGAPPLSYSTKSRRRWWRNTMKQCATRYYGATTRLQVDSYILGYMNIIPRREDSKNRDATRLCNSSDNAPDDAIDDVRYENVTRTYKAINDLLAISPLQGQLISIEDNLTDVI